MERKYNRMERKDGVGKTGKKRERLLEKSLARTERKKYTVQERKKRVALERTGQAV